jgi:hypothetical protein
MSSLVAPLQALPHCCGGEPPHAYQLLTAGCAAQDLNRRGRHVERSAKKADEGGVRIAVDGWRREAYDEGAIALATESIARGARLDADAKSRSPFAVAYA